MDQRSRRRRVAEMRELLMQWAEGEGVSTTALLGLLLYFDNWSSGDRNIARTGWNIFKEEEVKAFPSVTLEEAIWMIERSGMSQAVYQEIRLRLKDRMYFPPVMHVRAENQRHRPALQEYHRGVKASFKQCLSLSLTERLQHMDLSGLDRGQLQIYFKMCWGLDGSGDHSDYHQLSKVTFNTKQVMSVCFGLKEVEAKDQSGTSVIWTSKTDGANKPQNTRPLAIFPAKENSELLKEFIPVVEAEVKEIKLEGLKIDVTDSETGNGEEVLAQCSKSDMTMIDGKMINNLLNCQGAFCTMCTKSQPECQDPVTIQAGFLIDRDIASIRDLAIALQDPETGEVVRKTGDYAKRQGVCGVPVTETDLTKNIPVCHSKIRSFEWIVELVVRYLSHQKWATPSNGVKYTKEEWTLYKKSREEVKEAVYEFLAINIGNPGDMVTGQSFQKFSSDSARAFFVSLLKEEDADDFSFILIGLCAAVKVINSQKRSVNTAKLRELTQEVYLKIVERFPWAVVTQSIHRILAHAHEVIELNQGFGLGDVSEEGLEALNKLIRQMREHGSRKDCTMNNFQDTFHHLWDRSRPTIVEMERKIKRKKAKLIISSEIEALVESLFLEE